MTYIDGPNVVPINTYYSWKLISESTITKASWLILQLKSDKYELFQKGSGTVYDKILPTKGVYKLLFSYTEDSIARTTEMTIVAEEGEIVPRVLGPNKIKLPGDYEWIAVVDNINNIRCTWVVEHNGNQISTGEGNVIKSKGMFVGTMTLKFNYGDGDGHVLTVVNAEPAEKLNMYIKGKHTVPVKTTEYELEGCPYSDEQITASVSRYTAPDFVLSTEIENHKGRRFLLGDYGIGTFSIKFITPSETVQRDIIIADAGQINNVAFIEGPNIVFSTSDEPEKFFFHIDGPWKVKSTVWKVDNKVYQTDTPMVVDIKINKPTTIECTAVLDLGSDPSGQQDTEYTVNESFDIGYVEPPVESNDSYNVAGWRDNYLLVGHWVVEDLMKCVDLGVNYKDILNGLLPNEVSIEHQSKFPNSVYLRDTAATKATVEAWSNGLKIQDTMNGNTYANDKFDS